MLPFLEWAGGSSQLAVILVEETAFKVKLTGACEGTEIQWIKEQRKNKIRNIFNSSIFLWFCEILWALKASLYFDSQCFQPVIESRAITDHNDNQNRHYHQHREHQQHDLILRSHCRDHDLAIIISLLSPHLFCTLCCSIYRCIFNIRRR